MQKKLSVFYSRRMNISELVEIRLTLRILNFNYRKASSCSPDRDSSVSQVDAGATCKHDGRARLKARGGCGAHFGQPNNSQKSLRNRDEERVKFLVRNQYLLVGAGASVCSCVTKQRYFDFEAL